MATPRKIGIIICDRYRACAGGKCFRSFHNREGAFERYAGQKAEIVGYTACGGCPGGNVEYAPAEMKKNGSVVVHFATGVIVGYPPCPHIQYFEQYVPEQFDMEVVVGTHPIPEKYYKIHTTLGTWKSPEWRDRIQDTLTDEKTRLAYD
jgi:predicted metal-binding protein